MNEREGSTRQHPSRAYYFLAAPIAIAIGDFFLRWGADFGYFSRLAPGNLVGSFALSVGLWLALSRIAGTFSRRWIAAFVLAVPWALMVNGVWGYREIRGQDPTPGIAFYIVQEPKNAVELLSGGVNLTVLALLAASLAVMTLSLGAHRTKWSRVQAACAVLALAGYGLASFGWYLPNPSTECSYQSDVYVGVVIGKSIQRAADVGTNDVLSATVREPIDPVRAPDAPERPPNVVVIIGESLNRNMMSHHGYGLRTTPKLDAFLTTHADGVVDFEWAFANSAFSPVSVGTLMNGIYAGRSESEFHAAPSLWQYAQSRGIYSFLVATQQWSWSNLDFFLLKGVGPDVSLTADNMALPIANDTGVDDRLAAERFVEQLEIAAERGTPWFGTFQTNASHFPLLVDDDVPWETESTEGRFASATHVTDESIGTILDALDAGGHLDDTVIIFTADHSEVFENALDQATPQNTSPDFQFGGRIESCHPLLARVPFFVYLPPSLRDGGRIDAMRAKEEAVVSHVDIVPTVLDLWGLEPVNDVDGISLVAESTPRDYVLCFTCPAWSRWLLNGFAYIGPQRYLSLREDFDHALAYDTPERDIYLSRITGRAADDADLARLREAAESNDIIDRYLSWDRLAPLVREESD